MISSETKDDLTGVTLCFLIFIPQLFGQVVRRPSQFCRCAWQDKKQKDINKSILGHYITSQL